MSQGSSVWRFTQRVILLNGTPALSLDFELDSDRRLTALIPTSVDNAAFLNCGEAKIDFCTKAASQGTAVCYAVLTFASLETMEFPVCGTWELVAKVLEWGSRAAYMEKLESGVNGKR